MATTTKKFKKKRLFRVSRELNVAVDTLVEHLENAGYADTLSGKGINASITDEDAYIELLDAFADDRETASRVEELRAARRAAQAAEAAAEKKTDEEAEDKPSSEVVEEDTAADVDGQADIVVEHEEEVEEEVAESEDGVVAEEEEVEEEHEEAEPAIAETEVSVELVEEKSEDVMDTPAVEEAVEVEDRDIEAEPTVAKGVEPDEEGTRFVDKQAITEVLEGDGELDLEEADDDDFEEDSVLKADRYQLEGTKVLGKVDLDEIQEKEPSRKRKRKRKRKSKAASTDEGKVSIEDRGRSKKRRKKSRRPRVDEEDVEQTLQETLRELEHGAARVRQRRRRRRRERHAEERERERLEAEEQEQVLKVTEYVSTGELANLMAVPVTDVIQTLLSAGMMVSINQRLDADTIQIVADEYGFDVEFIQEFSAEDIQLEEDDPEDLEPRAPVVTVMGHVDHGKTSLLDYVRKADVAAGEAGGITQHIGAYNVKLPGDREISFLDTPGHEAFTAMRARGAKATDIVILVVAANDSVMPQTVEAINHAKAAEVPMVVAINKMDLPEANAQKVMAELAEEGVLVEQYGGSVQCAEVSAKTGEGIDDLLDKVLLEAELRELKANPNRKADGIVIESRLEKGRGNVATILVQNGTLRVGDPFVVGIFSGRVRAMFDERDNQVNEVGPSEAALVLGLSGQPEVGDQFIVMDDESEARDIAQRRQQIHREQELRQRKHISLDDVSRRMALGEFQELNLIIKGDVGGSVEALSDSLLKLRTDEVAVNVIHTGVGAISESDVMLASASDAVIIGFQVRPTPGARRAAEREEIDVRLYSIIYNAIEEVRDALEGMLSPEKTEEILGTVEVREIFKVPKVGTVAGCYVTDGRIHRNDKVRLIRDGVVIYDGAISSLKRFKDDVREVQTGFECGLSIENYNDIKIGDVVESYKIVETKRTLEV